MYSEWIERKLLESVIFELEHKFFGTIKADNKYEHCWLQTAEKARAFL